MAQRSAIPLYLTTILASGGASLPLSALARTAPIDASHGLVVVGAREAANTPIGIDEQNEPDEVLFEADSVMREVEGGPIIATGQVNAYFGDQYLRANYLSYHPETQIVIAKGNVAITNGDRETVFADEVELSGDLRDGIAKNFSALLEENARLAADNAVQEQGARTRLRKAVYTACNVCDSDGHGKTPTWRMKALRVTRDKERRVVRFHHTFFELKGVPILYVPFVQTPDPSVERQSGLLTPSIGTSDRLGFNFELPYYLAISNSQDATFSPKFTTNDGILWKGEYRRRGKRSYNVLAGGVINHDNNQLVNDEFGDPNDPRDFEFENGIPGTRWHFFGKGYQDFGDGWRASYDLERVSDKTYLREYDIERRGELRNELDRGRTNRLRSNARLEYQSGGHDLQIDSYLFQGLRASDSTETTPFVVPLVDYQYNVQDKVAGGKLTVGANTATLLRTAGTDTHRFTASSNWQRTHTTNSGHRFNVQAELRGDLFHYRDLDLGTEFEAGIVGEDSRTETRFAPSISAEWTYPLMRDFGGAQLFIEPRVQVVASNDVDNPERFINEDSRSIEFDYASLFEFNKATGYDAFEDGQRANIGVASSAVWQNGLTIETAIGQQFRVQSTEAFPNDSGLGEKQSDLVGSLNIRYKNIAGIENRVRIAHNPQIINGTRESRFPRRESFAFMRIGRFRSNASYVFVQGRNSGNNIVLREELNAGAALRLTKHWSTGVSWRINLENTQLDANTPLINPDTGLPNVPDQVVPVRQDIRLSYNDECSSFGVIFRRDRTRGGNLEPNNSVLLSFTLKSLVQ